MKVRRSQRGTATVEYVAMLVLAGGLTLGVARSPASPRIADACASAFCAVTGGLFCDVPDHGPAPTPEAEPIPTPEAEPAPTSDPPTVPEATEPAWPPCAFSGLDGRPPSIHSHNDYDRNHLLTDALDHEAASVEADIFYDGGNLKVSHGGRKFLPDWGTSHGTLADGYIDPLIERVEENDGQVYSDNDEPFYLNVEFKDGNEDAQRGAFLETVREYERLQLAVVNAGGDPENVQLVLSGNVPDPDEWESIRGHEVPAGVYLDQQYSGDSCADAATAVHDRRSAWVSLNWNCVSGNGEITPEEQAYLNQVVDNAHDQGLLVRFWGGPDGVGNGSPHGDTRAKWDAQLEAGVDLINTDHLTTLQNYLPECAR